MNSKTMLVFFSSFFFFGSLDLIENMKSNTFHYVLKTINVIYSILTICNNTLDQRGLVFLGLVIAYWFIRNILYFINVRVVMAVIEW